MCFIVFKGNAALLVRRLRAVVSRAIVMVPAPPMRRVILDSGEFFGDGSISLLIDGAAIPHCAP